MPVRLVLAGLLWLVFAAGSFAEICATDDLGNRLVLREPADRIVSLAPNITELLFHIGAGEQIVGADEYSNYPEQARKIPRVNNYAAANYEFILSLEPDLVIAWQSGNGEQMVRRIRQLGLPLFVIEPRTLTDIPDLFERLGALTGHDREGAAKAATFRRRLDRLRAEFSGKTPVRVFYQIWNEPLITLNGEHLVSAVIELCGGKNVFGEADPLVPYVNIESVLGADPQVIIASGSSDESPAWLDMWRNWPGIDAVQNGHVYFIPPDLMQRHSARILDGAERLCRYLDLARSGRDDSR